MFPLKPMLSKLPARFCPLAERLGTSQGRHRTQTKELSSFPHYFFSCDYVVNNVFGKKYRELTFNSESDLSCVKDNLYN